MADEFVTVALLTNYPGVSLSPNADTNEWVVQMVNDLMLEVFDDTVPSPIPATVTNIAYRAAARALSPQRADGLKSLTIQIDDYKETQQFADTSSQEVGVYLTADERAALIDAVTDDVVPRIPVGIGSFGVSVPGYR